LATDDLAAQGFCVGWVVGFTEGENFGSMMFQGFTDSPTDAASINAVSEAVLGRCIPVEATTWQLRDVILKHLEDNPEQRHESARFLANLSFRLAFPCP